MTRSRASAEGPRRGPGPPREAAGARRIRARVTGTVQGVGFRPFVYRLAHAHGLDGWVLNDTRGVLLEVEGEPSRLDAFFAGLAVSLPPLARIDRLDRSEVAPLGRAGFAIVASGSGPEHVALAPPDAATCGECLAELHDPADRRFRYPFLNCTNCGPRFTIVRGIPYDRPLTTMAGFAMCDACATEYADPRDRRFHAQANACPVCGPAARLMRDDAGPAVLGRARDAVQAAAAALVAGRIVAVKGIGGYHLACRADAAGAVAELRARKRREEKPFALMAPDLDTARSLVELSEAGELLLTSPRRPIVIAPRRQGIPVAPGVAPAATELGVMLPYSPLHHLLLGDAGMPLVMTSGNASDEPIAHDDEDALARLRGIADLFLVHDRPIQTRTDDSVVRLLDERRAPLLLRRSRGFVPEAMPLPTSAGVPLLACGGDLKSTFCLASGGRAWVGPHIGDLTELRTLRSYGDGIRHLERLCAITPELIAHDMHPDYRSTAYALGRGAETMAVQHHHAHLAACLAEHGEEGPAIGAIFDGSGYGLDGTVWGGELLVGDVRDFTRAGALWPVRMPGGDQAVHQPWRMTCAWLMEAGGAEEHVPGRLARAVDERRWAAVAGMVRSGVASPLTSSAGRLFDAVAAACGLRAEVSYEGQAAIELEAVCAPGRHRPYGMPLRERDDGLLLLDARTTIREVMKDLTAGVEIAVVAARFHAAVAAATAAAVAVLATRSGVGTAVLSGGVFANRRLLEDAASRLEDAGLRVLVPRRLPPGDGGLSYGQAAVAAALSAAAGDTGSSDAARALPGRVQR